MDPGAIKSGVAQWFTGVSGVDVLWQDAPLPATLPALPYALLHIHRIDRIGRDEVTLDGPPDEVRVIGNRRVAISCAVKGVAQGALAVMARVQDSLGCPTVLEQLANAGLSGGDDDGIAVNLNSDCAELEVKFLVSSLVADSPGRIETVQLGGQLYRAEGAPAVVVSDSVRK